MNIKIISVGKLKEKISKARDRGIHKKTLKILLPRNHRGR